MAGFQSLGYGGGGGGGGYAAPSFGGGLSAVGASPLAVKDADQRSILPGQSGTYPLPGAMNIYNQLLGLNTQNYNNVIGAFQSGINNLAPNLANIQAGYTNLNQRVRNDLGVGTGGWGVALPGANAIEEQFARARGEITQNQINSGLGNSTVTAALQNQNSLMAGRAYGELSAQLANTAAGYAANIGLQQQQAAMQGLGMQSSLYEGLGRTLGGYQFQNTAGQLYGSYSYNPSGGGGGGGGGYRGGGGGSGGGYGGAGDGYGAGFAGPMYHAPEGLGYAGAQQSSYYNPYPSLGASGAVASPGTDWGAVGSSASKAAGGWGDVVSN